MLCDLLPGRRAGRSSAESQDVKRRRDTDLGDCGPHGRRPKLCLALALVGCAHATPSARDDVNAILLVPLTAEPSDLIPRLEELYEVSRKLLESIRGKLVDREVGRSRSDRTADLRWRVCSWFRVARSGKEITHRELQDA